MDNSPRISAANLVVRTQSDRRRYKPAEPTELRPRQCDIERAEHRGERILRRVGSTLLTAPDLRLRRNRANGLNGQEIGVNTTSDVTLATLNSGSNLTLGGNLSTPGQTVTLTSAGTISEQPGVAISGGDADRKLGGERVVCPGGQYGGKPRRLYDDRRRQQREFHADKCGRP